VVVHNADYWRSRCQQGFLLSPGSPGSISLYGKISQHENFSEQICAEILREHIEGERVEYYDWVTKPGVKNDLLDSTVGAMVNASIVGASFDNPVDDDWQPGAEVKTKEPPKPRVREATYTKY
jgi:hypothetical protein